MVYTYIVKYSGTAHISKSSGNDLKSCQNGEITLLPANTNLEL